MQFDTSLIKKASLLIQSGELVAFPTETVYGIGADATNDKACCNIYSLKGRPSSNPLIVHVDSIEQAMSIAVFNEISLALVEKFWPGPLTLVLPLRPDNNIAKTVTAGLSTIAIRMPSDNTALSLIKMSRTPIAAPSANPSGYVSATAEFHVKRHFPNLFVLPSDNTGCGLESTIIDMSLDKYSVLRYGFITPESLSSALGVNVEFKSNSVIKAPGMMYKHYSPQASVRRDAININEGENGIGFGDVNLGALNLSPSGDLTEAAANLYRMLIILDDMGANVIAVAPIPNVGIGLAINDRLKRAAYD